MFEIPPIQSNPYSLDKVRFDSNIRILESKISRRDDLTVDEVSFLNSAFLKTSDLIKKKQYAEMIFTLSGYQYKALGVNGDNSWVDALEDGDSEIVLVSSKIARTVTEKEGVYTYYKPEVLERIWKKPGIRDIILPVIVGVASNIRGTKFSNLTSREFLSLALNTSSLANERKPYLKISAGLIATSIDSAKEFIQRFLKMFLENPEMTEAAQCCTNALNAHYKTINFTEIFNAPLQAFYSALARDTDKDNLVTSEVEKWSGKYKASEELLQTVMHSSTNSQNKAKILQSISRAGIELPLGVVLELDKALPDYKDFVQTITSINKAQLLPESLLATLASKIDIHRGSTLAYDKMALSTLAEAKTSLSQKTILYLDSLLSNEMQDARFQGSILTKEVLTAITAHGALPPNTTRIINLSIGTTSNPIAIDIYKQFGVSIEKMLENPDYSLKCSKLLKILVVDQKRVKLTENLSEICKRVISSTRITEIKDVLSVVIGKEVHTNPKEIASQSISAILNPSSKAEISIAITNLLGAVRKGHQLTSDQYKSLENFLSSHDLDNLEITDKENISIIFALDIMRRKNVRTLGPKAVGVMCEVASSTKTAFGVRKEALKNLCYMISGGFKSIHLQSVADTFTKALDESNPGINSLARIGFRHFANNETELDLTLFTNKFISHIVDGNISDDEFYMSIDSLGTLVDKGAQIPDEGLAVLFTYSIAKNALNELSDIKKISAANLVHKALEFDSIKSIMWNYAKASKSGNECGEQESYTPQLPDYILSAIPHLLEVSPEVATITFRTLNLYQLSEGMVQLLPQGLIETIINGSMADETHSHLKNEACIFLANAISSGYIPHPMLGNLLSDAFEYNTPGELILLRNAVISGGFIPTDDMIYGLSDIVASSNNSTVVGTAIATLMTAIEARDLGNPYDTRTKLDYVLIASDIESALELEDKALFPIVGDALNILQQKYAVPITVQLDSEINQEPVASLTLTEGNAVPIPQIRTVDQILASLRDLNTGQGHLVEFLNSGVLEERIAKVDEYRKIFADWDSIRISAWAKEKGKTASIEEIIAIVDRANELVTGGHHLRDTQIISSILILDAKANGRLAQVKTGEGKTTIVAIIAIAKALHGQKVDVITSSPILAERDAESKFALYEVFGLSCSHNIEKDYKEGLKGAYEADIVYGDVSTFQHDYLRHSYNLLNTRGDRKFEDSFGVVDEVDSMMLDEKDKIAKIASHSPGMEYLVPLYSKIWLKTLEIYSRLGGKLEDRLSFKVELETYSKSLVDIDIAESKIGIPKHLRGFARIQASDWAESAIMALEFKENRDYVIVLDEDGRNKIAPVDYANTGTTRINTAWQNGLHQFLQLKHLLAVTAENFTSAFISNMGYFKLYGNNISGLTGTLGSKDSIGLLEEVYKVDTAIIPTFANSKLVQQESYLAKNTEDWAAKIASNLNEEVNQNGRAALVLCETIEEGMQVASFLEAANIGRKITLYTRSDIDDAESLTSRIDSGEIIVATNLAGRGTDIITTDDLESNGGLHVCLTFMPRNQRVEDQGIGRTARQGKAGSSIIIANVQIEKEKWQVTEIVSIAALKSLREKYEEKSTDYVRKIKIPKLQSEDELFHEFSTFAHEMMRSQVEGADPAYSNLEVKWGMWLKTHLSPRAEGFNSAKLKTEFEEFKSHIRAEYTKIEDPVNLARMGYDQVSVGNYKASYKYYLDAINKDPQHGFIAAYNMAYAVIRDNNTHSQRYDGTAVFMARDHLDRADTNIDKIIANLESMAEETIAANPREAPNTEFLQQIDAKICILKLQKDYIAKSKSVLDQIKPTHRVGVDGYTKLQDLVPDDPIYKSVVLEFNQAGLHIFYDLGARPAPKDPGGMIFGMIAAAVSMPFTAGLSASLFGAGSVMGAGFGGMMGSLAGTFGSNLYEHKGRIDLAIRDSTKVKALRSAVLDGLSGAMFAGVVKGAKIDGFKNLSGAQKVTRIAQHEAIKAGISAGLRGENLRSALKRGAGNALMQSASLGVTSNLASSSGFERTIANTLVQSTVAGSIGRDVASTAIGTAVSSTMLESNIKVGKFELQDFSAAAVATVVAATGGSIEQVADGISAAESARFTRGLVKDDIREAIARGEKPEGPLGVAAGDPTSKNGSLEEEVREELELEKVTIHSKALEKRALDARRLKELAISMSKEEIAQAEAIKSSAGYIFFGTSGLDDTEKSLISRHDALFAQEIRTRHVQVAEGVLGPLQKSFANLFLPKDKQLVIGAEEIAGTAASSARPIANLKIPAKNSGQISGQKTHSSASVEATGTLPVRRGADGKIRGVGYTQEHHILHQKLYDHELWERAGMSVEDRSNKMLLPTTKGSGMTTTKRSVHQGRHLEAVKRALESKMNEALTLGKQEGGLGVNLRFFRFEPQTKRQ